jgi:hypothetical protein
LYLLNQPWEAWAVNIDTNPTCHSPLTRADLLRLFEADQLRLELGEGPPYPKVVQLMVRAFTPWDREAEYVDVGRFDWNWVMRQHYVSIRCGRKTWCEIGSTTPQPSPTNAVELPRHLWVVKGWHDEQRFTTVVNGVANVATFRATLVPDADLAIRKVADFEAGWVPVAKAYLTQESALYKKKLNFEFDAQSGKPNLIYYHKPRNSRVWKAKIVSAVTGEELIKDVLRRPAPFRVAVPATARWRWLADDETVWTKCDEGCCEIIG